MQWLAAICVRRPVFASVLVRVLVVVGLFAFGSLGVDRFPKVELPFVVITTRLRGSAPEEVEREITDEVEQAVNTVSGVEELRGTSSEGVGIVFVTFELEKEATWERSGSGARYRFTCMPISTTRSAGMPK